MKKAIIALIGGLVLNGAGAAHAITVDGTFSLAEWAGSYASDDGVGKNGYVGPGYGGQAFDVEYLGLRIEDGQVYFGLQTGFNLKNGRTSDGIYFGPGDFALNVDADPFYEYAIDFSINTTTKVAKYTLYEVTKWQNSYYAQHISADPFQMKTGNKIGSSFAGSYRKSYNLSNNKDGGYSYVLEGVFDGDMIDMAPGVPVTLHWTMGCGNDYLNVSAMPEPDNSVTIQGGNPVPEPGTILLVGIGLAGLGGMARTLRR